MYKFRVISDSAKLKSINNRKTGLYTIKAAFIRLIPTHPMGESLERYKKTVKSYVIMLLLCDFGIANFAEPGYINTG